MTSYAYDNLNRRTSETDPLSHTTSYAYDAAGRLLSVEDPLGNVTSLAYDNLGRRTSVTQPDPDGAGSLTEPVTSFTYDDAGRLLTEIDPLGNVTSYAYDDLGRLLTLTQPDPDGAGPLTAPVTTYGYDALSRRTSVTDALGNMTSFAFDAVGNLLQVTEPYPGAGPQLATVYAYDDLDRLTSVTDPLSNATSYAYDAAGRLLSETNALSGVTSYVYDNLGRRMSLTDPEDNTTTWVYDAAGRVTSETNELSDVRSFIYDNLGRLIERTDRNGRIHEFDYDAASRLTEERWLASDGLTLVDTITRTYDANSRLTSIADGDSSYAYSYDAIGRLTEVDNAGTSSMPTAVLSYSYDAAGRRTAAAATIAGTADFSNAYTYDDIGRMTRIEQTDGAPSAGSVVSDKRVDLAYDALGRFETITRYEDLTGTDLVATSSYSYDVAGRLTDLDHAQGTSTLAFYDWTYDAHGRLTGFTSTDGTATYSYDTTDQLTAADYDFQTDESYAYDENGNRTSTGYSTGANNRLLSDGTHTYEYDDEGNRTKKTTTTTGDYVTYEWDHKNQLVAVSYYTAASVLTKRVEYGYDPSGRRLRKNVDDDGDGTFDHGERFVYDGAGKIDLASGMAIDDVVLLFATDNPATAPAGSLETRFLHGSAIDQIFADEDALGEILWSLEDHQGSIRDLVNYDAATDTTSVVNHIIYDAFGVIITQTDPLLIPHHAYTAQEWDTDAGLYHYNARWYDTLIGSFISEDPSGFDAGDTNLGRYVGNGPTNATDPSGRQMLDPHDVFVNWVEAQVIPGPLMVPPTFPTPLTTEGYAQQLQQTFNSHLQQYTQIQGLLEQLLEDQYGDFLNNHQNVNIIQVGTPELAFFADGRYIIAVPVVGTFPSIPLNAGIQAQLGSEGLTISGVGTVLQDPNLVFGATYADGLTQMQGAFGGSIPGGGQFGFYGTYNVFPNQGVSSDDDVCPVPQLGGGAFLQAQMFERPTGVLSLTTGAGLNSGNLVINSGLEWTLNPESSPFTGSAFLGSQVTSPFNGTLLFGGQIGAQIRY